MLVTVYKTFEEKEEFSVNTVSIKEVFSHIKFIKGKEFTDSLLSEYYNYILLDNQNTENFIVLTPEVILNEFPEEKSLLIFPKISGELPVPLLLAGPLAALLGGTVGSLALAETILATLGNLLISIALNAVMQALSPTPEFNNDPSQNQAKEKQSSLFNGAPLIREQGGSVPIIFGNPFCGGVLISSGITSEDIV